MSSRGAHHTRTRVRECRREEGARTAHEGTRCNVTRCRASTPSGMRPHVKSQSCSHTQSCTCAWMARQRIPLEVYIPFWGIILHARALISCKTRGRSLLVLRHLARSDDLEALIVCMILSPPLPESEFEPYILKLHDYVWPCTGTVYSSLYSTHVTHRQSFSTLKEHMP